MIIIGKCGINKLYVQRPSSFYWLRLLIGDFVQAYNHRPPGKV